MSGFLLNCLSENPCIKIWPFHETLRKKLKGIKTPDQENLNWSCQESVSVFKKRQRVTKCRYGAAKAVKNANLLMF